MPLSQIDTEREHDRKGSHCMPGFSRGHEKNLPSGEGRRLPGPAPPIAHGEENVADPSVAISRGVTSCTRVLARARTTPYGGKTWLIRNVAINRPLYSDSRAGTQNPLSGGGENVDNCENNYDRPRNSR